MEVMILDCLYIQKNLSTPHSPGNRANAVGPKENSRLAVIQSKWEERDRTLPARAARFQRLQKSIVTLNITETCRSQDTGGVKQRNKSR